MKLHGKIKQVRFFSEESYFIVGVIEASEMEKDVLFSGYMKHFDVDLEYCFSGEFYTHPKYGKQFKIENYQVIIDDNRQGLINYLSSSLFNGVGQVLASQIADHLGDQALELIKDNKEVLNNIKGMTFEKRDMIYQVLCDNQNQQDLLQFFMSHHITLKMALKIMDRYQEETKDKVEQDPYQIINDIDGIGFKTIDKFALSLGVEYSDMRRIKAVLLFLLKNSCQQTGSTYLKQDAIFAIFSKEVQSDELKFMQALQLLKEDSSIMMEETNIYPSSLYEAETIIVNRIKRFMNQSQEEYDFEDVEEAIFDLQEDWNITYDEHQIDAMYAFLENDIMILTGGPGTGKTTIVKAMIALYRKIQPGKQIALIAPTGRASKRLSDLSDIPASTIHRLLKWNLEEQVFSHDQAHPIEYDLVVIDEFSMVDTLLFSHLLKATDYVTKILLIGDQDQLPSIAPGNVLKDLIATKLIETVELTHIFRQNKQSGIIQLAHQIRNNQFQSFAIFDDYQDINFYDCLSVNICDLTAKIINKAINEGYDLYDFQVLAPMYVGVAGIDAINETLQEVVNPAHISKKEIKVYHRIFREGDKILQLKNRLEDNVFNGDIGILLEIQKKDGFEYLEDKMIVDYEGTIVEYSNNDFNSITHAYCISIHKAQGSEFKIVVLPVLLEYRGMLQKKLVYTAITRTKQALFILGDKTAFIQALKTEDIINRNTSLKEKFYVNKEISLYDFEE